MIRPVVLVALAAILVLAAGCGGTASHAKPSATERKLTNLNDISQLKTAFNTASDEPRLVVLVSPT